MTLQRLIWYFGKNLLIQLIFNLWQAALQTEQNQTGQEQATVQAGLNPGFGEIIRLM